MLPRLSQILSRERLRQVGETAWFLPRLDLAVPGRARMVMEMAVLFGILLAIDHGLMDGQAFAVLNPNPYWLPVVTMPLCYGGSMGLLAALVATIIWVTAPHAAPGGDHLQLLLSISIQPMLWVIVALVVGETTSSRLETARRLDLVTARHEEEFRQVADTIDHLSRTNRALQVRIATEEHTVGKAIAAAVDLVEAAPAQQVYGIERLVGLATQSEDFIYYGRSSAGFVARFRGAAAANQSDFLSDEALAIALDASQNHASAARVTPAHPAMLSLPIHDSEEHTLIGMLIVNTIAPATFTASKQAELSHLAQSLGKLAQLPALGGEPLPLGGLLLQEGVA